MDVGIWTNAVNGLAQFGQRQLVGPGPVADRFLASGERLGDGPDAHPLAGEQMQLLDFILPPRLAVAFEFVAAHAPSLARAPPASSPRPPRARPAPRAPRVQLAP